jgi:alpha-galactosidase
MHTFFEFIPFFHSKLFQYKKLSATFLALTVIIFSQATYAQKYDGLAKTPPMGWNTWNKFHCSINEQLIREMADAMVANGMKGVGYEYINIDDCWHGARGPLGNIWPNAKRFPSGMKSLADYVHARGLKLGIYSDAGDKTCAGYPGSFGHEKQDALTYASWGIDYVKYDWCETNGLNAEISYRAMSDAIRAAGRPMLLSICEWGTNNPVSWAPAIGHSWRTTADIYPCWNCEFGNYIGAPLSILNILDLQGGLRKFAGPDHWNDMDMLEVGNGISDTEGRAHFTIWAMMASPLISGNDLRHMSDATIETLTNKDVIALNQDPLGIQALLVARNNNIEVFVKPLVNNEWAIMFLNRGEFAITYNFNWVDHDINDEFSKRVLKFSKKKYTWVNLWNKTKGSTAQVFNQTIPPHDVVVFRLTLEK